MTEHIPGGHFLISRLIFKSAIWWKHPWFLRLFLWLIGKAVYLDGYTFKGHVLKRGELITTYGEIADALAYQFNRAVIKPTQKEIRIMLSWLKLEGMILMKPIVDGTLVNKGTPIELTRAYIGMLITVVNYDTYQISENYKGTDKGTPSFELGQLEKEGRERMKKIFSSDSIEVRLSELLLEKIISRNPNHKKPNIQTWAKDVDRMIRIDERAPDDIRAVIEWCQADPFWQNNILSTVKLRRQFDQLRLKMKAAGKQAPTPCPPASSPNDIVCPRCRRELVARNELDGAGCVYCQRDYSPPFESVITSPNPQGRPEETVPEEKSPMGDPERCKEVRA